MSGPPKPSIEIELGEGGRPMVPELPEDLLEQVSSVDLVVERLELGQAHALSVGEVPAVLQPDVAGFRHQRLVLGPLVPVLIQ